MLAIPDQSKRVVAVSSVAPNGTVVRVPLRTGGQK